jgi:hypothetical protein
MRTLPGQDERDNRDSVNPVRLCPGSIRISPEGATSPQARRSVQGEHMPRDPPGRKELNNALPFNRSGTRLSAFGCILVASARPRPGDRTTTVIKVKAESDPLRPHAVRSASILPESCAQTCSGSRRKSILLYALHPSATTSYPLVAPPLPLRPSDALTRLAHPPLFLGAARRRRTSTDASRCGKMLLLQR